MAKAFEYRTYLSSIRMVLVAKAFEYRPNMSGIQMARSVLGHPVLVKRDHPKSGFVRYSDPYCICVRILNGRLYNGTKSCPDDKLDHFIKKSSIQIFSFD